MKKVTKTLAKSRHALSIALMAIIMVASTALTAQVAVNTDGSSADGSAMLDVKSSVKGFLPPRMTTSERDAIASPANGLMIYNTSTGCMNFYIDGGWEQVCAGTGTPNADYTIGTGGLCANTTVNGTYFEAVALVASNTVNLDVLVTTTGPWSITTNTVNGYNFSGSGSFASTGTVQVTLSGTGTPITAQTDNFTASANGSGGTCTFDVTVVSVPPCGAPISYGGQNYNTLQIGTQCWMAENLNIGTMINGSSNQTNNGTIEKYCFNDNTANCDVYGGLYQWDEMMAYVTTEGAQGICPAGWHLPTDAEWMTLEEEAETTTGINWNNTGWRGTDAGGNLKEAGTSHWASPNTGATNSSGFTGLPGGERTWYDGTFYEITAAYFWSSSLSGSDGWYRYLGKYYAEVLRVSSGKASGMSVRCVKN